MKKDYQEIALTVIVVCLVYVLCTFRAYAQSYQSPLEKLKTLPSYITLSQEVANLNKSHKASIRKQKTNYAMLFYRNEGAQLLFRWLGEPDSEFIEVKKTFEVRRDFILGHKVFVNTQIQNEPSSLPNDSPYYFEVLVLIPKPTKIAAVSYGLIPAFANLVPPNLSIKESKDLVINDFKAKFFKKSPQGCSIYIKLSKGAVFNASITECKYSAKLIKLVESLNLLRLNTKLHT